MTQRDDKDRSEFEQWLGDVMCMRSVWDAERNCYDDFAPHLAWRAWQAARSSCAAPVTRFSLSPQELADLCTFSFGMSCDAPEDAMPITVGYLPAHESGSGWYVWGEEYPDEGSVAIHKAAPVPECATINAPSDGTKVLHGQVESPRVSNLPSYGGSNNAAGQGPSLTVKDDSKSPQGGRTTPATAAPTPAALSAELPGMLGVAQGIAEQKWPHTMDAAVWAAKFNEQIVNEGGATMDEGLLIGWFANAIMAGYDTALSRQPSQQGPSEEEIAIAKDGLGKHTIISDMATLRSAILRWAEQTGRAG